jgi:hypothetical protein
LSDVHIVGERYGFRIESGRSGPRGNDRLRRLLVQLEVLDAKDPLDAILITGDMKLAFPPSGPSSSTRLRPIHASPSAGNHDLNIVDRANPARMDLPTSPNRRLRQIRSLGVMSAVQGRRVRVIDRAKSRLGAMLSEALEPHRAKMARFANTAKPSLSNEIPEIWAQMFPMILPPDGEDGLGILALRGGALMAPSFGACALIHGTLCVTLWTIPSNFSKFFGRWLPRP